MDSTQYDGSFVPEQSSETTLQQRAMTPALEVEIRHLIQTELATRTIPAFPAYFMVRDYLVTYDWLQWSLQVRDAQIMQLQLQVARLETPWWKRWFR